MVSHWFPHVANVGRANVLLPCSFGGLRRSHIVSSRGFVAFRCGFVMLLAVRLRLQGILLLHRGAFGCLVVVSSWFGDGCVVGPPFNRDFVSVLLGSISAFWVFFFVRTRGVLFCEDQSCF